MTIERAGWYAAVMLSLVMLILVGLPAVKYQKLNVALTVAIAVYLVVYYSAVVLNTQEATWRYQQYFLFIGKLLGQMWVITVLPLTAYFFMPRSSAMAIHWIYFMYIVLEGSIRSRDQTTPLVF